jgi:superfamily I DNA/RNA helicase
MATDGPTMVIAGAGSGKTRVLTVRIAHLLTKGVDPFRILALTFTNKAAKEHEGAYRQRSLPGGEAASLWMGTFHSVFARILRAEADKLGYPKDFTIYDTDDSRSCDPHHREGVATGRQALQGQPGARAHQHRQKQPDRGEGLLWPMPS